MAQAVDALIGTELAGYRIESVIGRGGMSVVYLAEDLRLGRPVALKLLAPRLAEDGRFRERFHRESRLAASLDHPNVIPIFEAGESAGHLYIAMRFVEGVDLEELLEREGRLEPDRAIALLSQIAGALDAAHGRGLVHRDVKPGNILVAEGAHAYLSDFGLTKRSVAGETLTEGEGLLGTIDYVAPEQIEGDTVDGRADVYSLACVLHECLAGEKPFPRDSDLAVLWAHVQDEPPPVSAHRPELTVAIDAVLARGLQKDPRARFARAGELMAAARSALADGAVPAERAPVAGPARKTVTVVYASVDASSATGGPLDLESLGRAATRCVEEMTAALERHGGVVETLAGHGVIGVFGLPITREDDTVRALRAADELRSRLDRVNRDLGETAGIRVAARVGLDTGAVLAARPEAGPSALTGGPMNTAARHEEAARPGEIILGNGIHELVAERVVADRLEDEPTAGPAWRLLSLLPEPPALGGRSDAPMVGREQQLGELQRALEEAVDTRSCRLVTVVGPAGIGKSRLVNALADSLAGEATVFAGRCLSYGEGITYWPVGEIVRVVAAGADPVAMLRRLLQSQDEGDIAADLVAGAIGLADTAGTGEETFWAIRRFFETLARERPLVLVFEDVHWAEPTLLDLLDHLTRWTRDAPILLVCLARPELFEEHRDFGEASGGVLLQLEPLTPEESARLATQLAPRERLSPGIAERIVTVAEGNPLFIGQLLAMASEDAQGARALTLPPAIQALLAARLDRLSAEERQIIECASIEGLVFHVGPLVELCPGLDPGGLWRHLLALTRKELVRPERSDVPDDEALRFQHALVREAAYQGIPKERRAELHERYAASVEHTKGMTALELEEIVGYHLEQAVRYRREVGSAKRSDEELARRASSRLAAAGRRALGHLDLPAAINLLERSTALLPEADALRLDQLPDLGAALAEAGRIDDARAVLADARRRADETGEARSAAHALVQELLLRVQVEPALATSEIERAAPELERLFAERDDELGLAHVWRLRAIVRWLDGRVTEAEQAWERAAAHARQAGDVAELVEVLPWLASAAFFGPVPVEQGIRRCEDIRAELRGNLGADASVVRALAGLYAMHGRVETARALLAEADATLEDLGLSMQTAVSHQAAYVAMLVNDPAAAEASIRPGYELLEQMGERALLSTDAALLAHALHAQGKDDEAHAQTEISEQTGDTEDLVTQILWRSARAKALAVRGETAQAETLARAAVGIAEGTEWLTDHADALVDLAEVLEAAGKPAQAGEAIEAALVLYEQKGNTVAAGKARARLATLDSTCAPRGGAR